MEYRIWRATYPHFMQNLTCDGMQAPAAANIAEFLKEYKFNGPLDEEGQGGELLLFLMFTGSLVHHTW